jgi:hypothetical protein
MLKAVCVGVVNECANMYGFNAEEALERLGARGKKVKVDKVKEKMIPIPFDGEKKSGCCNAIRMNHGLYTQCLNLSDEVCKSCMNDASKNGDILPYGTVEDRIKAGSDFKDSKGRKPTPYAKVLQKLKISKDEVKTYAEARGIKLDESELEMPVSEKKIASDDGKRGRPKKSGKVVEVDNSEDLFAGLVKNSLSENEVVEGETCKITDKQAKAEKLAQEKAEKKAALEAEKLAKADKLAQEKAEKKAALEAEKLAKAEKQAQEKAEKEAKKLALEKERAEKKAALEAAKAAKEAKKGEKVKKDKKTEVKDSDDEEETPEVGVKKFEINGKIYLRSNTNVLYDLESQDEIGVWNEAKQEIEFGELEEEEEEE